MASAGSLLAQVLHLPVEERASLVRQIAESLDSRSERGATEAWALEIGERVQALRRGELNTQPASEIFARAEARLQARRRG